MASSAGAVTLRLEKQPRSTVDSIAATVPQGVELTLGRRPECNIAIANNTLSGT
jgi:hypothetical protein